MRGSKRVPMLGIKPDGAVLIDLWCNSVQGQLVVAANTLTVLTGPRTNNSCAPERERADAEMLNALEQVTNWRRDGNDVVLIGRKACAFTVRQTDLRRKLVCAARPRREGSCVGTRTAKR